MPLDWLMPYLIGILTTTAGACFVMLGYKRGDERRDTARLKQVYHQTLTQLGELVRNLVCADDHLPFAEEISDVPNPKATIEPRKVTR